MIDIRQHGIGASGGVKPADIQSLADITNISIANENSIKTTLIGILNTKTNDGLSNNKSWMDIINYLSNIKLGKYAEGTIEAGTRFVSGTPTVITNQLTFQPKIIVIYSAAGVNIAPSDTKMHFSLLNRTLGALTTIMTLDSGGTSSGSLLGAITVTTDGFTLASTYSGTIIQGNNTLPYRWIAIA